MIEQLLLLFAYLFRKEEIQRELDDYVDDSRQLEKELEASLTQAEKKNKELEQLVNRTQTELDSMRVGAIIFYFFILDNRKHNYIHYMEN